MNNEQKLRLRTHGLRVAVVHDWIFVRRGGEKVLEHILDLFPGSDLYFLFGTPEKVLKLSHEHRFFPSFLAGFPFVSKIYKFLLPLLPTAIESFDLTAYDLIVSTSSCVAKGVIPSPAARHISYIHSPMRYAWDQEHHYFPTKPSLIRPIELMRRAMLSRLRVWDSTSSHRADALVANSRFVQRRCQLYYGKNASVVYPPVELERFLGPGSIPPRPSAEPRKVLLFSAWVPYKKMRMALAALVSAKIPVIAAGQGGELKEAMAQFRDSPLVEFHEHPSDAEVKTLYDRAHTFLLPAVEDFGIVVVEAMAAGLFVVAPSLGGTGETVVDGVTGFHFQPGNLESMITAVKKSLAYEKQPADLERLRAQALKFSPQSFREGLSEIILEVLAKPKS